MKVGRFSIMELTGLAIARLQGELAAISFTAQEELIAARVIKEIDERLTFLVNVGLGYLSMSRRASTLSGGEAQRIRLASQIGSRLAGVLYILDEPSIGLHQRDNQRLIDTLTSLRDLGNTVIVVEHDSDTIMAADYVLDMGPGAGVHGGMVVYSGPVEQLLECKESQTGGYLSGRLRIEVPAKRRKLPPKKEWLVISEATANNLHGVTVAFPYGVMTCVTGVSGSGKSSLVIETLYKQAVIHLNGSREVAGPCKEIKGLERFDKVIDIDQSPIGRTPRSNPATYTGVLTPIRELLARLPEARARGLQAGALQF